MRSLWLSPIFMVIFVSGWSSPGGRTVINEPAPQMSGAIAQFKQRFGARYAKKSVSQPVASLLAEVFITPVSVEDEKRLELTSGGGPRVLLFSGDGKTLSSDGQSASGLVFQANLQNHPFQIPVDIPAHLLVSLDVNSTEGTINSVVMNFSRSVAFHTDNVKWIPLLPHTLYLETIAVSDVRISYTFSDSPTGSAGEYVLNLNVPVAVRGGAA